MSVDVTCGKCGEKISISDLSDRFVKLNDGQTARPKKRNVAIYREIQAIQGDLSASLRGAFSSRSKLFSC